MLSLVLLAPDLRILHNFRGLCVMCILLILDISNSMPTLLDISMSMMLDMHTARHVCMAGVQDGIPQESR